MTPERLEQIQTAITEKPVGELEHVLPELLAEVDRLRAAADGLNSWLGTRRDVTLARSDEMFNEAGTEYQFHGGQAMAFNEAKRKGHELGLWE